MRVCLESFLNGFRKLASEQASHFQYRVSMCAHLHVNGSLECMGLSLRRLPTWHAGQPSPPEGSGEAVGFGGFPASVPTVGKLSVMSEPDDSSCLRFSMPATTALTSLYG